MPLDGRHYSSKGSDSGYFSGEEPQVTGGDDLLHGVCPVCQDNIDCNEQHCVSLYCEGNVPPGGGYKVVKVCTMADVKRLISSEQPETPLQLECGHKLHMECLAGIVKAGADEGGNTCPLCNRLIAPHSRRSHVQVSQDYYGDMALAYARQHDDMQSFMTDADVAVAQRRIDQLMLSDSQSDRDRATELQRGLEAVRTNMVSLGADQIEAERRLASFTLPEHVSDSHLGMLLTQYQILERYGPASLNISRTPHLRANSLFPSLYFKEFLHVSRQPSNIHEMLRRLELVREPIYSVKERIVDWAWDNANDGDGTSSVWQRNSSRIRWLIGGTSDSDYFDSLNYLTVEHPYSHDKELMGPFEGLANLQHVEPLMVQFMQQMMWSPNESMIIPNVDANSWSVVPADLFARGLGEALEIPSTMFMIDSDLFQATDFRGWMAEIYAYNRQQRGGGCPAPDVKRHRTAKRRNNVIHGGSDDICSPIAISLFLLTAIIAALPRP
jgi:hypothetical protein